MKSIEQQLKDIEKSIQKQVNGNYKFEEVFTKDFMRKNTKYSDIYEFIKAGGFICENQKEFELIDKKMLDEYIKKDTKFSSWKKMGEEATTIMVKNKLGLK